ncbi:hypothetical protein T265_06374 [Opisthorchis viverrini]|uniref:Uncharacterized protein n=1 Tax=Opisthorchis viverrini TaxID=6198 RepID=A0A075ADZ5_OPIVI|nr:hypothetical protein T265_06374 [Opisthorchis viverrini]KER26399.1 hypothetical protein T265_06374 [Opisthorchis viverrini]
MILELTWPLIEYRLSAVSYCRALYPNADAREWITPWPVVQNWNYDMGTFKLSLVFDFELLHTCEFIHKDTKVIVLVFRLPLDNKHGGWLQVGSKKTLSKETTPDKEG